MKKTKVLVVLLIFAILLGITTYSFASSFNFKVDASATTLKPGDMVTIDLGVANIDVGESGINTLEAVLEYDENVFEPVISSSFAGLNNWSITYNNEEGENKGKLVAVIVQEGVKEDQAIGRLTLKVKEGIKDQTTKITFKNIKTNDGTNEILDSDKVITVSVKSPAIEEPEKPEKPTENVIENTTVENIIEDDDTKSPEKLPQTGSNVYIIVLISILVLVIGIVSYLKYKQIKNVK